MGTKIVNKIYVNKLAFPTFCGISGFSWKFQPLKNIFRTLENGHSIRHQSIPPLSAGRDWSFFFFVLFSCAFVWDSPKFSGSFPICPGSVQ